MLARSLGNCLNSEFDAWDVYTQCQSDYFSWVRRRGASDVLKCGKKELVMFLKWGKKEPVMFCSGVRKGQ